MKEVILYEEEKLTLFRQINISIVKELISRKIFER